MMAPDERETQAEGRTRQADRHRDPLLSALAELPCLSPDPIRSQALMARATRAIARRRVRAQQRMELLTRIYVRVLEPAAACALSAAFLAAVLVQAVFIVTQSHSDFLWR